MTALNHSRAARKIQVPFAGGDVYGDSHHVFIRDMQGTTVALPRGTIVGLMARLIEVVTQLEVDERGDDRSALDSSSALQPVGANV